MSNMDDFSSEALDAVVRGGSAPAPASSPRGAFVGDPAAASAAIERIADPGERAKARAAFQEQAARTPGFNQGAKFPQPADSLPDFSSDAVHKAVTAEQPRTPATPPKLSARLAPPDVGSAVDGLGSVVANQVSGIGANIVGGWRGLSTLLTGGSMDDAANNARDYASAHTYQPEEGTAAARNVQSFASPANPMNYPGAVSDWAGGKVTDLTGSPTLGALVTTGGNAAALALGLRGRAGTAPVETGPARPGVGVYKPMALGDNPTAQAFAPQPLPARAGPATVAAPAPAAAAPAAAAITPAPRPPIAPAAAADPAAMFREINPETPIADVAGERLRRAQVLKSVGIDNARESSLSGDRPGGSTDLQISKMDSPAGKYLGDVLAREKAALNDHATSLVDQTGGTLDKDQTTAYHRGESIVAPLNELKQHFDQKAGELYRAADERAQGQPVALESFKQMLADDSEMTSPDFVQFRQAVQSFAKKNGMLQEDGSLAGTALQAETLRKWLNQKRSYSNSPYVDGLKESLDNDVMSSAGQDLYTEARSLWRQKKDTLDNPNGIAKLMQAEGPDGVNRAVPFEQIAPKLAKMPVDQFGHVIDTLRSAPAEIQPTARAALNEVRAHFANEVRNIGGKQQGQWNASGASKYLRENAARMSQVFSPEEMAQFQNLSEAGQIVAKDQSYPGAAVQGHNLARAGVSAAVQHGAQVAGTLAGGMFGPGGAALGSAAGRYVGDMAAGRMHESASLKSAQKRTVRLSDLLGVGQ